MENNTQPQDTIKPMMTDEFIMSMAKRKLVGKANSHHTLMLLGI